ncbi:hypothetical protein D3870_05505 [Noviherbaspirillum cavernae]|uniref:Uncharacterized protein n=1 Tax=Noviherbaspirillum cavernae TaxID=2320862 RepID=A0A418WZN2_9BURK|nr:hypothetical protein [Noviherbaspirillum cavernae]RJG05543.1 hypothetical protein D3870_05505 [Noviherbaspirillum cavernae]
MSTIMIRNLSHSTELDRKAMSVVHGGTAMGSPSININVPVSVNQQNYMVQNTNVLNGSAIGAGAYLPGLKVSPTQVGMNYLQLSSLPTHFA